LARAFNTPLLPVTASANGAVVTMVAVGFTPSFSVSYNNTDFQSFRYIQRGSRRRKIVASGHDITYDALVGNLSAVTKGMQGRSYYCDGIGRLKSEVTPEAGTVTLAYVTSSGALCSGNPTNPCTKIDARGSVTT
jgi:hypothetical protein